jgi:DNA polymerase-1
MDAIVTYRVYKKMEEELSKDSKLERYYYDDMMPDERMFIDIEMEGVYIDWERVEEVGNDLRRELRAIEQDIYDELGYKIDVNSSKKIGKALEEKGLPPIQRSKESVGAYYLTNEYCLTEWKKQEYHIAKLLLDYHEVNALLQTFVGSKELNNAYWGVRKGDGKLHPNFLVRKAKSHRHRCKDPNLQQVPSHGERAKMIRSFFIPPSPEYVIGKRDYSGLQLRIGAILSGDKNMKAAFQSEDDDLHSMTAIAAFHPYDMTFKEFVQVKEQAPYKEERFIGKQANFSLLFSGRPYSFCESTIRGRWSKKDCKDYMKKNSLFPITDREGEKDYHLTVASDITEKFFQLYNRLIPWHKECHKEAETAGFVRCYHGARRNLVQLLHIGKDEDFSKMSSLKNISINTRVQNYEIVIISRAMREMHKYFKENNMKSRIFVTIHDEIGFYLHKSELPHLKVKLPKLMDQYYEEYDEIPIISDGIISDPYNEKNPTYWGVSGEEW